MPAVGPLAVWQLPAAQQGPLPALLLRLLLGCWLLAWAAAAPPPPQRAVLWPLLLLPPPAAWQHWLQAEQVAVALWGQQLRGQPLRGEPMGLLQTLPWAV